jgi:hypothetical protein
MTDRDTDRADSEGGRPGIDQSANKKPLARSVAKRLNKLRARVAKKDAEEMAFKNSVLPNQPSP